MLKWLGGKEQKPDHAMASVEEAARLLADLPREDPVKALAEIGAWVESVAEAQGFTPELRGAVLKVLDETGHPFQEQLLGAYLGSAHLYDLKAHQRWQAIFNHWKRLSDGFAACAAEFKAAPQTDPARLACAEVHGHAIRATAQEEKARHLCYQPVEQGLWQRVYALQLAAERLGVAEVSYRPYKFEPLPTSPAQELLRVLMLEMAAPDGLAPEHVELAFRIVARVGGSFASTAAAAPGLRFCVDLAQPKPPAECPAQPHAAPTLRFFGAGTALARLQEMINHNEQDALPTDRRFGREFSQWDRVTTLRHLLLYWGDARPQRRGARVAAQGALQVYHGYNAVRRVVARIETGEMENIAEAMKSKSGLALTEDKLNQLPETWLGKDASDSGIGAEIPPGAADWVKIGRLCAVKPENGKAWWVGVLRRIDAADAKHAHAGIEVLSRRAHSLWLKLVGEGQTKATNWETSSGAFSYAYIHVVLLFPEGARSLNEAQLLMDPEDFIAGLNCEALMGDKSRLIRLLKPLDTGEDFVIAAFQWES